MQVMFVNLCHLSKLNSNICIDIHLVTNYFCKILDNRLGLDIGN